MMPSILLALLLAGSAPVTVFVGPMSRDGFVDADKGILDSVRDVQKELRKNRALSVVTAEDQATVKVYVVSRRKVATADGVVIPVGAIGVYASGESMRTEALLRVGSYEKPIVGESERGWNNSAGEVGKQVGTWVAANRVRLADLGSK